MLPENYSAALNAFNKVAKDLLPGGEADNKPDSLFTKKMLRAGIKDESEHTGNKSVAKEIAKDHLIENPHYYASASKKSK
jgi:hypothetical protein